jgi:hypothetical protein
MLTGETGNHGLGLDAVVLVAMTVILVTTGAALYPRLAT